MAAGTILRLASVAGCVAAAVVLAPLPARAAECELPPRQPTVTTVPYVQHLYDADRLAVLATGAGVRVAVIDSGVDATHPQLTGPAVDRGRDFLRGHADGRQDCNGHGTGVASIIAARPAPGTPFHGLAPAATIVPIRVSEQIDSGDGTLVGDTGSLRNLAEAIRWAANSRGGNAQVINMSLSTSTWSGDVCRAVAEATARNVVVVAAVGNAGAVKDHNPTPYPAGCPDVIGVGAVTAAGVRADYSGHGDYVDLVAAGDGVTAAARRGGHTQLSGTSAAAPLVAATAALILQRYRGLTPKPWPLPRRRRCRLPRSGSPTRPGSPGDSSKPTPNISR
jgi:subtilisin family serine protease